MNQENETENKKEPSQEQTKKKIKRVEKSLIAVLLAFAVAGAGFLAGWFGKYLSLGKENRALLWAIEKTKEKYYEDAEDELYNRLFASFQLDAYSGYSFAEEYDEIKSERNGVNKGVGLSVTTDDANALRVFRVTGNSPSEKAGIKRGMYILKYGLTDQVSEMTDAVGDEGFRTFLQEQVSTKYYVLCGFERNGSDAVVCPVEQKTYSATYCFYCDNRTSFSFKTPEKGGSPVLTEDETGKIASLPDGTGYIRINQFTGNVVNEFKLCLDKMNEQGNKNLVLDLRGNGGGYLDSMVDVAAYLIKYANTTTKTIAYAMFRNGERISYAATDCKYNEHFDVNSKISVLADEYSASASECLIGALIDYESISYSDIYLHKNDTGIARTYGKGIMQSMYEDGAGNMLKLTVARVYWPKGKSIHGMGITEADGAVGIVSPLLPGASDAMLESVIAALKAASAAPQA